MKHVINKKVMCLALLACLPAQAEIYKCVNKQGKIFYNDKPCPVYDKETKIKAVKDPKNGYIPPAFVKNKEGEGKSAVVGFNADKKVSTPVEEKDSPKNEHSSPVKDSESSSAGSSSSIAPSLGSGRVPSPYFAKMNKKEKGKSADVSATLPRVELKVENRAY